MLFMPFRPDIGLDQVPFVTILVCLVCLVVYTDQHLNEEKVIKASESWCLQQKTLSFRLALQHSAGEDSPRACDAVMSEIHIAADKQQTMRDIAFASDTMEGFSKTDSVRYINQILNKEYAGYASVVPVYATQQLWYEPHSWNWKNMITAAFAHTSWTHLLGNLFFFFAFATAVEMIIGHLRFSALVITMAMGTHIFYSIAMAGVDSAAPTVGLSGVVMGMMALFAFFMPTGRIRCFLWVIVIIRQFALPAWLFVAWYIGWDMYALWSGEEQSGINIVAHVSGAAIGFVTGLLLFRGKRKEIRLLLSKQQDYAL